VSLRAAVVYSRLPEDLAVAADDRFEEFDLPEVPLAVAAALRRCGVDAFPLEDDPRLVPRLLEAQPDFVFNLAEGLRGRGREAVVPAICEHLGLPYTGSDALTLAATLDKGVARRLVAGAVAVPEGVVVRPGEALPASFPLPAIVKPVSEGSSKGIHDGLAIAFDRHAVEERVQAVAARYRQPALVEGFVAGPEVTVAVLGCEKPEVAAMMQVLPQRGPLSRFVYTIEAKRDWQQRVRYAVPPELPAEVLDRLRSAALAAFRALECRDVARLDFRLDQGGMPYFLEANPLPGLSPDKGDIVFATGRAGLPYDELIARIAARAMRETVLAKAKA
jgi:D-alanine-D-alanine ligase